MKEILKNAKKIRNILIYFIDNELKKSAKKNNNILIDSKTPKELSKQYQQFSNYRMDITETYNGSQVDTVNFTNYFHVAVSYTQFNNKYNVSYENKNYEKVNSNNIVGKYVDDIHNKKKFKYENEKNSYKDLPIDSNKKRIIGDKKFNHKRKTLLSSIEIPQKVIIPFDENNSDGLNNKKNMNKLENENKVNNNETVCVNKKRKLKVNYYENKLKKYCSNLIILKRKKISKKQVETKSPPIKFKQKDLKKNFSLTKERNEQTLIETPNIKKSKDSKEKTETKQINSKTNHRKQVQKTKEKLLKIPEKKSTHKRMRAQSIKDTNLLLKVVKNLHRRNASPKKLHKQLTTQQHNDSKNKEIISQKIARKERDKNLEDVNEVKKMISGSIRSKRKIFAPEKTSIKWSNKAFQTGNKFNFGEQLRSIRRPLYKRANTINKVNNIFHFKGNELKFKENN